MPPEEIKTEKKPFLVILTVGCIAIAIISFYVGSYVRQSQGGFTRGTVIETYKVLPPGFPAGLIPEGESVKSASVINYPSGRKDISVSYVSLFQPMATVIEKYGQELKKDGWNIQTQQQSSSSGAIFAVKDKEQMSITFIPNANAIEISFLYITKQ